LDIGVYLANGNQEKKEQKKEQVKEKKQKNKTVRKGKEQETLTERIP
jgi:hypothetical protein